MSAPVRGGASSSQRPPKGFELLQDKINDFQQKMREAEAESSEFRRKTQVLWPILRIAHQRSRYIWQMLIRKVISQDVYDYCVKQRFVDAALVAYWKKPGYEHLCCLQCAQHTSQYGSACICRVPSNNLTNVQPFECKACGCRGCSGIKSDSAPKKPTATVKTQDIIGNKANAEEVIGPQLPKQQSDKNPKE
jgi:bud site selection protein 31